MPHKETRKIIRAGNTSLAVILPRAWLRYYELTARDEVLVVSNGSVTISPMQKGMPSMNDITIKERIDHCKAVASYEVYRGHGGFLTDFLNSYLKADTDNALILLPAFEALTAKYHMKEDPEK